MATLLQVNSNLTSCFFHLLHEKKRLINDQAPFLDWTLSSGKLNYTRIAMPLPKISRLWAKMIDSICARKPAKLRVQVCSLPTAVSLAKVVSIRRLVRFKVGLLCSLAPFIFDRYGVQKL